MTCLVLLLAVALALWLCVGAKRRALREEEWQRKLSTRFLEAVDNDE